MMPVEPRYDSITAIKPSERMVTYPADVGFLPPDIIVSLNRFFKTGPDPIYYPNDAESSRHPD